MNIVLAQLSDNNKQYFKNTSRLNIEVGSLILVDTDQGLEVLEVLKVLVFNDPQLVESIKPIIRLANDEDLEKYNINNEDSIEVIKYTNEQIKYFDLEMIVLSANYTLDRDRLTIYFKSENRVDFRELVRELSKKYQTRIELRQVGSRDVAKMIGGIGPCGLVLCCNKFIGDFDAVTIRMAKNQELSLNPRNISGICGKLLCCLKYEDEVYEELKMLIPDVGSKVQTDKGAGFVSDINFIGRKIKVKYRDEELSDEWLDYRLIKE